MSKVITMTSKENLQIQNNSCVCKFFCSMELFRKIVLDKLKDIVYYKENVFWKTFSKN